LFIVILHSPLPAVIESFQHKRQKEAAEIKAQQAQQSCERRIARRMTALQALEAKAQHAINQLRHSQAAKAPLNYPKLNTQFSNLFLLGSPLGLRVVGVSFRLALILPILQSPAWIALLRAPQDRYLSSTFSMPHCPHVFNIFHPYDPLASRLEFLIEPSLNTSLAPVQVDHVGGRGKRIHKGQGQRIFVVGF